MSKTIEEKITGWRKFLSDNRMWTPAIEQACKVAEKWGNHKAAKASASEIAELKDKFEYSREIGYSDCKNEFEPQLAKLDAKCQMQHNELSQLKDALRWRKVEEELPEDKHETFIDGKYVYTIDPFIVKTMNGRYTVSKRVKFIGSSWNWIGSANFSESVIEWLPIPQEERSEE